MGKSAFYVVVAAGLVMGASACGGDEADSSTEGPSDGAGASAGQGSGAAAGAMSTAGGAVAAGGADATSGTGGTAASEPGIQVSTGNIDVSTDACEFTPCGGDLGDTSWEYAEGCLWVGPLLTLCPQASYDVATTLTGSLEFTTDQVTRNMSASTAGTANVPSICTVNASCADVGASWQLVEFVDDAECVAAEGGCDCTINGGMAQSDAATYFAQGTTLTIVGESITRTFEYCVEGDTLTYEETTTDGADPGIYQLSRLP